MSKPVTLEALVEARRAEKAAALANMRVSNAAVDYELRAEAIRTVRDVVTTVLDVTDLDEERVMNRFNMLRRDEYGRVPGAINILASIYAWPVASVEEASSISEVQENIMDALQAAGYVNKFNKHSLADMLMEVKEVKGFHTFLDNEKFETVEGVEPAYDELSYLYASIAQILGLPLVDFKLTEDKWEKNEAKIIKKVEAELEAAEIALAEHEEVMRQATAA